jgi:hypothetical protein
MTIWHTLWSFALSYDSLVYFVAFCRIFPILEYYIKKNLATLIRTNVCLYLYVYECIFDNGSNDKF